MFFRGMMIAIEGFDQAPQMTLDLEDSRKIYKMHSHS